MSQAQVHSERRQARRTASSRPARSHPLPPRPIADVQPEPAQVPATEAKAPPSRDADARGDAVAQLAETLQTAERAHRAYVAELCRADVVPAEDWSTWYAEYLLGLR